MTSGISHAGTSVSSAAQKATSSLSRAEIVGVVVAILALTALIVGGTWWLCVRSAKRRDAAREEEAEKIRERVQTGENSTDGRVNMQELPTTYDRLNERRGSERTIEEEWSHQPLREADNRGNEFQGNDFTQEYGQHQYAAAPLYSPMTENQQTPFRPQ